MVAFKKISITTMVWELMDIIPDYPTPAAEANAVWIDGFFVGLREKNECA